MRRKDREITDLNEIHDIMKRCDVCSVAFFDEEFPYIIPLNFGVHLNNENTFELLFHGAKVGTKIDLLKKNPHVGFEMNCSRKLIVGEKACDYTMEFESVCGNGIIEILGDEEKINALTILMDQYHDGVEHEFDERVVKATTVLRLTVAKICGKKLKVG